MQSPNDGVVIAAAELATRSSALLTGPALPTLLVAGLFLLLVQFDDVHASGAEEFLHEPVFVQPALDDPFFSEASIERLDFRGGPVVVARKRAP
jgi:hypothetical protein